MGVPAQPGGGRAPPRSAPLTTGTLRPSRGLGPLHARRPVPQGHRGRVRVWGPSALGAPCHGDTEAKLGSGATNGGRTGSPPGPLVPDSHKALSGPVSKQSKCWFPARVTTATVSLTTASPGGADGSRLSQEPGLPPEPPASPPPPPPLLWSPGPSHPLAGVTGTRGSLRRPAARALPFAGCAGPRCPGKDPAGPT